MVKRRASRSRSGPRKRRRTSSMFIRGRGDYVAQNMPIVGKTPPVVSNVGNPAPWNPLTWTNDLRETSAKAMATTKVPPKALGFWGGMFKYALPVAFAGLAGAGIAGSLLDLGAASAGMTAQRAAWTARTMSSTEGDLASFGSRGPAGVARVRTFRAVNPLPRVAGPNKFKLLTVRSMPGVQRRMTIPMNTTRLPAHVTQKMRELQRIRDFL